MNDQAPYINLDDYVTKQSFVDLYPNIFTKSQLDWIVKIRRFNGFDVAVRKIGQRKILIHIPSALAWIDSQAA